VRLAGADRAGTGDRQAVLARARLQIARWAARLVTHREHRRAEGAAVGDDPDHPAHRGPVRADRGAVHRVGLDHPHDPARDPDPGVELVLHEKGVTTMETPHVKRSGGAALLSDAASPAQLRIDLWNRLRDQLTRAADRPLAEPSAEIDQLL